MATYYTLDQTGTQAAAYPSEDVLWRMGPPINASGAQVVSEFDEDCYPEPPAPRSLSDVSRYELVIDEQLNGQTPNATYELAWVNPEVLGPTGYGPWNDPSNYQTGHSQNILSNPASEQGWGVGPARAWAHYPQSECPNPDRNMGQHLRNGQYPYVSAETALYYRTQLEWEQQWAGYKFRSPVAPVANVPPSVPFVQTVPTYGGGFMPLPGVDVPYSDLHAD
jgi:hypothetical protein